MPPDRDAAWDQAWSQALNDIEMDVEAAEQLLLAVRSGRELPSSEQLLRGRWEAPRGLGPLPLPLVARASALLERQQEVARRLAEACHVNRRHARVAVAHREAVPAVPVYLDVAL